ncbi:MAG: DNA-3-methyladenine glycosylase 2 family protein [Bryobacterales bacterium]|nr:DNA-3-methyladenine glycosylase 2 family protein [Bryobacterales bacterium]MBV9401833.1 DNA-3-methyladenine glycosylase 2 family protein [Bryobacterales bacterium]
MDVAEFEKARLARDARYDGRFFIGVTSTGIYCRPICPAPSPKPANVRFFQSAAAAAEAGFRPCLRCRPEASPGTPAWMGSSSSVSRALKLIGEGALDDASVDDLAGRLGIGSRHLRRLFLRHLGATPVAVAQTRRVHFAKRLIDDTDLPMTEVALASGFSSIRRFNATFRTLYGRTPSELRSASAASRVHRAPGEYVFRLSYRPPAAPREYRRRVSLGGRTGAIAVRPIHGKNEVELHIDFPEPAALLKIVNLVRQKLDLQ